MFRTTSYCTLVHSHLEYRVQADGTSYLKQDIWHYDRLQNMSRGIMIGLSNFTCENLWHFTSKETQILTCQMHNFTDDPDQLEFFDPPRREVLIGFDQKFFHISARHQRRCYWFSIRCVPCVSCLLASINLNSDWIASRLVVFLENFVLMVIS